mgnify:CR=1 FL=1
MCCKILENFLSVTKNFNKKLYFSEQKFFVKIRCNYTEDEQSSKILQKINIIIK